jgi:hypothetical protein
MGIEAVSTGIAAISMAMAILAFILSKRADSRAQAAARGQLFLALRSRFIQVHEGLPPNYYVTGWKPKEEEMPAARRYWHHSFDEWYLTTRLNDKYMRELWDQYFSDNIFTGLRYEGLRDVAVVMKDYQTEHENMVWQQFRAELDKIWKRHHPRDGTTCTGIDCKKHE